MRIYRVERECGCGPYAGSHCPDTGCYGKYRYPSLPVSSRRHPTPDDDGIKIDLYDSRSKVFFCGFESTEKLVQWFKGFFGELDRTGFGVSEYQCDGRKVKKGDKQVMFNRSEATLVSRKDISSYSV